MEYADVANAAATLEKDGIKPTVLLVRAKLGKGSLRDITPLLKRWKAERKGETTATAAALPEHIAQTIAGIIAQERAAAIATIQAELNETAKERDELAEALAAREDDANDATVTIGIKRERIAEMQGEITALREQIAKLEQERDDERERRIRAEMDRAAAEARIDEIRKAEPSPTVPAPATKPAKKGKIAKKATAQSEEVESLDMFPGKE